MKSGYWVIAQNTYQEARHNKVLHIGIGFAAALILFSIFLGEVSLYQNIKIVKDIGMASISIFGVFTAVFLGVNSLYRELERRTIYTIVSKPIDRAEILLGKFFGMTLVLFSVVAMMTVYLYLCTSFTEGIVDFGLLPAIFLIFLELLMVAAIAVFFSSFSTPFLSGFFTVGMFIVGRLTHTLSQFGNRSGSLIFKSVAMGVQRVFDLKAFDLRSRVVFHLPVYREDVLYPTLYAFFFIAFVLALSILLFERRDFK